MATPVTLVSVDQYLSTSYSPDREYVDRASHVQDTINEYLACGVPHVWLVDPLRRRAWVHTAAGSHEATDGVLRTENPEIAVSLAEILAAL